MNNEEFNTQLESLSLRLEELKVMASKMNKDKSETINFPKEDFKNFVRMVINDTINNIKHSLPNIDDHINLDLNYREITVDFHEKSFIDELSYNIHDNMDDEYINLSISNYLAR